MDRPRLVDEPDADSEMMIDLTAEQAVAADMAMLLDLGAAEELADLIAAQSLGRGDTVADRGSEKDEQEEPQQPAMPLEADPAPG